jgi:hypothetical protein
MLLAYFCFLLFQRESLTWIGFQEVITLCFAFDRVIFISTMLGKIMLQNPTTKLRFLRRMDSNDSQPSNFIHTPHHLALEHLIGLSFFNSLSTCW